MKILGIETSCDETAAAVVKDGTILLSHVVVSQIDIHKEFGGVVPEVAARSHLEVITPVIEKALTQAFPGSLPGNRWEEVDAIAVTAGPGLSGSLLIGSLAARTLAITKNKPVYGLHHVLGHVFANFIIEDARPLVSARLTRPPIPDKLKADSGVESSSTPSQHTSSAGQSVLRSRLALEPSRAFSEDETKHKKYQLPNPKYDLPKKAPKFPILALIVSGGHSQLVLFKDHLDYQLLGQTLDDAVGEAFDKVAKIIGLPYPGGPSISERAEKGDSSKYKLPISILDNPYDFSFSGLKTAVLRRAQEIIGADYSFPSHQVAAKLTEQQISDIAASFQTTAVKTLVNATKKAAAEHSPQSVVIAGGVAANKLLRTELQAHLPQFNIEYAPMSLCTDNAAMMAALGYYHAQANKPDDPYNLGIKPSWKM